MKAEELDADLHAALVTAHIGPNLVLFLLVMALLYDEMRSIECQMEAQTAGMDADAMLGFEGSRSDRRDAARGRVVEGLCDSQLRRDARDKRGNHCGLRIPVDRRRRSLAGTYRWCHRERSRKCSRPARSRPPTYARTTDEGGARGRMNISGHHDGASGTLRRPDGTASIPSINGTRRRRDNTCRRSAGRCCNSRFLSAGECHVRPNPPL